MNPHWFLRALFALVSAAALHGSLAQAADIVIVSAQNDTGQPAADLHVTFSGTGGDLSVLPQTVIAPGCPAPLVTVVGSTVTLDWGAPCVPDGAFIFFFASTSNGPLGFTSGFWTGAGGVNIGALDPAAPVMYGSANFGGSSLIQIDPATAASTTIGFLGMFGVVADIDCDSNGVLYGATGAGAGNLITIDPTTATETLIGHHGLAPGSLTAIEWVGTTLYAIYLPSAAPPMSSLVTLDPFTGAATVIGPTGFGVLGGLAYDPYFDVLTAGEAGGTGSGRLFEIDRTTGAAMLVESTPFGEIGSLEFHGLTRRLYGGLGGGIPNGGDLVLLDPFTADGVTVGSTGTGALSGITFCSGNVAVNALGDFFGGGLPNGIVLRLRIATRYRYIGLIKGPWFKPPGQCWARWWCWLGRLCYQRTELYIYKTFMGRAFQLRGCVPVTKWQFRSATGAAWEKQITTIKPPPGDPQVPPGGPPRDPPPFPPFFVLFGDAPENVHPTEMNLGNHTEENLQGDFGPTPNFTEAFLEAANALHLIVPGKGDPPSLEISFEAMMQERAAGFCNAGNALQPLAAELLFVHGMEPSPEVAQLSQRLTFLQGAFCAIAKQMQTGIVQDPLPFKAAANLFLDISNLLGSLFQPDDPHAQRFANASEHLVLLADGMNRAAAFVVADMYDGVDDLQQRDGLLWVIVARLPNELYQFALAMTPHVAIHAQSPVLQSWRHSDLEGAQVMVADRGRAAFGEMLDMYQEQVSEFGIVPIRMPDRDDGNVDEQTPLRVKVKLPVHLSQVVDVPPGDGVNVFLPPAIPGDVNGDDCIDDADLQFVKDTIGQGGEFAPAVPPTDVDANGIVDLVDLAMVQASVGLCGQSLDDCNGNSINDLVDIKNGDAVDCNANNVPDSCDIASGWSLDENENDVPDECDCPADIDGDDNVVNLFDLLQLLANWGTDGPGASLSPPDDVVNLFDLLQLLSEWGPCDP